MKLTEFSALCGREWAKKERGGRGDVIALHLTEAGWQELAREAAAAMPRGFSPVGTVPGIVNPVTRSTVRVTVRKDRSREAARVRTPHGCRRTWWPAQ